MYGTDPVWNDSDWHGQDLSDMRGSDAVVFSWTEVLGQSVISIPVFGEPSRDNSAAAGRAAAGGLRSEGFRNSKTI